MTENRIYHYNLPKNRCDYDDSVITIYKLAVILLVTRKKSVKYKLKIKKHFNITVYYNTKKMKF